MEFLGLILVWELFILLCKAVGFVIGLFFRILFFWVPKSEPETEYDEEIDVYL